MDNSTGEVTRYDAPWVFTATEKAPVRDHSVVVDDGIIVDVLPSRDAGAKYPGAVVEDLAGCSVMPGLVNCHSHATMPGDGRNVEEASGNSDAVLLLRAARNVRRALESGVTTLADLGSRDGLVLSLRAALAQGETLGPRMVVAGRAATSRLGHCWTWGGAVTGVPEMRRFAKSEFSRGADILKVMATGGGTAGTDPFKPQFDAEELAAAVEEAGAARRPCFAHCSATRAVRMALEAGVDVMVHGTFHDEEGNLSGFDRESADMALERGTYWNPTLAVARSGIPALENAPDPDWDAIARKRRTWEERADGVRRLHEMGVPIVAGSDEGWGSYAFGGYALELYALAEAGIPTADVLLSATILSSRALGVDAYVGSLEPGKRADILAVEGKPFERIADLDKVKRVILGGVDVSLGADIPDGFSIPSFEERWC